MEEPITITIERDTHGRLSKVKMKARARSFDQAINYLIKELKRVTR